MVIHVAAGARKRQIEGMNSNPGLVDTLIRDLHCEALVLADEARAGLARAAVASTAAPTASGASPLVGVALACEGMRTVARMVDGLAWIESRRIRETVENGQILMTCRRLDRSLSRRPGLPGGHGNGTGAAELIAASKAFHQRLQRVEGRAVGAPRAAMTGARALQRRLAAASLTAPPRRCGQNKLSQGCCKTESCGEPSGPHDKNIVQ